MKSSQVHYDLSKPSALYATRLACGGIVWLDTRTSRHWPDVSCPECLATLKPKPTTDATKYP